ncbi:MAG: SM-20-related protein [Sphingobacteriales bacterium]|jgi:SM-20-related protein
MDNEEILEEKQFEGLIQGLIDNDYACCDNFINQSTTSGLRTNIESLNETGKMKPSGVGNKSAFHQDKQIRGDKINWIGDQSTNPFEMVYLKKINNFILYLNRTCYASIKSFESHYSNYDKKSFYKRHLDQFKNEKGRKYSTILYLNDGWKDEDGGNLTLHPKNKAQVNISPSGGRLVFFRSDEMEHEVHPSFTRNRNSIAGWLKD